MSVAKVLKLDEYRDRRHHRLRLAHALLRADAGRRDLVRHLEGIAEASGADRVAAVWVDEYGPGLIHPFVVLDLLADRPRRHFQIEPLQRAWEIGVPGAYDQVAAPGKTGASTFAIALGSDGTRAWFVVADSVTARPALDEKARDRLMFLAGECSAVALHRDLGVSQADSGEKGASRFTGWPILKDLEGREDDEVEGRRIAQRFVVARLVRMLVDQDLVMPDERITELVGAARRELSQRNGLEPKERGQWARVLELFERRETAELASVVTELGEGAEDRGHEHGARELYSLAYALAAAIGVPHTAATAARFLGRLHKRRARRDPSFAWYGTAYDIAAASRLHHVAALALAGQGGIKLESGNLPVARRIYEDALELADKSGHGPTVATVYRGLLSLEQSAGDLSAALEHGWKAVGASSQEWERTRSLASLAGALEAAGDYEVALDAWSVVAETSSEVYLQVFANDALSHIHALRGEAELFARYAARCDALGYHGLHSAKAQILYYRGLSYRALGERDTAEGWLRRAVAFAEEHGFNEVLFRAEEALRGLPSHETERLEQTPAASPAVRSGLQAMRRELVGSAS